MSKTIITFLFSLIILASIVAPTFINFSESTIEITEIVDFGEEEENNKKTAVSAQAGRFGMGSWGT